MGYGGLVDIVGVVLLYIGVIIAMGTGCGHIFG